MLNKKISIGLMVIILTLLLALISTATITDAISAVATVILVWIAWQANGTWRREIRAKKKYDLASRLYEIVLKIEEMDYDKGIILNSIYFPLKTINFEYDCLNEKQTVIDYFISKFSFCEKNGNEYTENFAAFLLSISIMDFPVKNERIGQESQTFYSELNKIKEFCKKEMKDFYKS